MSLDAAVVRFLNGFVGKSVYLDATIVFFARRLPYLIALGFFVFLYNAPAADRTGIFITAAAATLIARFGVTELIRVFYKRPRPFIAHELRPLVSEYQWSFPSGHAAFFFALATVVYVYDSWWGSIFFITALLTAIGRVTAGVHYPSDILAGCLTGVAVAYGIVSLIAFL